jgi:hypothetical protein
MIRKLLNFAVFQAGWFAAVLSAAHGRPAVALAAAVVAIGLNLWLFSVDRAQDFRLLLAVAAIGFGLDTLQINLGAFAPAGSPMLPHLCPPWLAGLWGLLGTTLRASLGWLARRYLLAAWLGAIAGPLCYLGGARLGAAALPPNRVFSVLLLAAGWAAVMPLLTGLAHGARFRGNALRRAE